MESIQHNDVPSFFAILSLKVYILNEKTKKKKSIFLIILYFISSNFSCFNIFDIFKDLIYFHFYNTFQHILFNHLEYSKVFFPCNSFSSKHVEKIRFDFIALKVDPLMMNHHHHHYHYVTQLYQRWNSLMRNDY